MMCLLYLQSQETDALVSLIDGYKAAIGVVTSSVYLWGIQLVFVIVHLVSTGAFDCVIVYLISSPE